MILPGKDGWFFLLPAESVRSQMMDFEDPSFSNFFLKDNPPTRSSFWLSEGILDSIGIPPDACENRWF